MVFVNICYSFLYEKTTKARAAKLSKKRKQEIAKKAIEARWKDVKAARGTSPSPIYFFIDVPCLF